MCVELSAFGALNGSLFGGSRLVHAMGKSGTLPSVLGIEATVFGRQTPIAAILSQASLISVLVIAVGTFKTIVRIHIFAQWWFYLATIVALLYLRRSEPDLKRPFRVPTVLPILFVMESAFVCGVLIWQSSVECGVSLAVLAAGTPIYFLQRRERRRGAQSFDSSNTGGNSETTPLLLASDGRADRQDHHSRTPAVDEDTTVEPVEVVSETVAHV
jgi:amino acid transporter